MNSKPIRTPGKAWWLLKRVCPQDLELWNVVLISLTGLIPLTCEDRKQLYEPARSLCISASHGWRPFHKNLSRRALSNQMLSLHLCWGKMTVNLVSLLHRILYWILSFLREPSENTKSRRTTVLRGRSAKAIRASQALIMARHSRWGNSKREGAPLPKLGEAVRMA